MLEHLHTPEIAVAEMARVCATAGRVFLSDDDHALFTLDPICPAFERAWPAYMQAFEAQGLDPRIGKRLPTLLVDAGLTPTRSGYAFYGGCRGDAYFDLIVRNLVEVMRTARDTIARHDLLDAATYDADLTSILTWGNQPGAAIWYALNWAEGRKRPEGAREMSHE